MNEITTTSKTDAAIIESVVIGGDLAKLTAEQRVSYYQSVCSSLGLNPLTKPFSYITLNGRLVLYANKDASEQLRRIHDISIEPPDIKFEGEWIVVTVVARDKDGRADADVGVVKKTDMQGNFGNALMKAITKAKRRVTLSICGLGMLDETEVETIPDAKVVTVTDTGEIAQPELPTADSKGKEFADMEVAELVGHLNAYIKRLKDNPHDEETLRKRDECQQMLEKKRGKK